MDWYRPHFKFLLVALLVAGSSLLSAVAQESMVFSKPSGATPEKADSFMNDQHNNVSAHSSPTPFFTSKPEADFNMLPGFQAARPRSPDEIKQMQKVLDDRRNWTLLTPEQILGIPTPEKILGLPDPNHEENLSAEQRYINRQMRQQNASATNAIRGRDYQLGQEDNALQPLNSDRQNFDPNSRSRLSSLKNFGQPGTRTADFPEMDPNRNDPDSIWRNAFSPPRPVPNGDLEQVAAMERFRAMMSPAAPVKYEGGSAYSHAPLTPVPDPYLQHMPSSYNPHGASFTPVQDFAARPMGINPLPTITGQMPNQAPPAPTPLVKPPPWLSDEPQPGVPLRRKF